MTRSILVGEVRTGRRITQIPVSGASWKMVHRAAGDVTVDIPITATDFARLEQSYIGGLYPGPDVLPGPGTFPEAATPIWRPGQGLRPEFLSAIEPARCFMAVVEGDVVLEAGPIWAHDFDLATGVLTVKAAGLRSLFDHRVVMGVVASGTEAAAWDVTYTSLSLGTIAKRLIALAMSHTGGALPIVLPDDEVSTNTRTYYGYELGSLGDRLDQLMGVIDGPDIALTPRLTADRMGVEWVLRTGTVEDPTLHQAGDDHVFDSRAVRGGVSGLSVSRDATGMAERAWVSGEGTQESLLMEFADNPTLLGAGFPLMESSQARGSVSDRSTLTRWAQGDLASGARPTMAWSASVRADASPRLGSYRPGDTVKVWVPADHPYLSMLLPEGFHRARILDISGGMGDDVRVTFVPSVEVR